MTSTFHKTATLAKKMQLNAQRERQVYSNFFSENTLLHTRAEATDTFNHRTITREQKSRFQKMESSSLI